jgi:hypothetical protein
MPTFPIDDCAIYGTYSRNAPSRAVVRTQMEVGPPKVRRRSSMGLYTITAAYAVTSAQLTSFNSWFRDDAGMGAISFDWTDPRSGTVRAVRFAEDGYSIVQVSPKRWRLDVRLEEWI